MSAVPLWLALPVAVLLITGSTLVLIGAFGLIRLEGFYRRMHAPSIVTSWGTGALVLAAMIYFSAIEGKLVLHEIIIGVFVMITTPVTMLLLSRAAMQRDRAEGRDNVPPPPQDPVPAPDTAPGQGPEAASGLPPDPARA